MKKIQFFFVGMAMVFLHPSAFAVAEEMNVKVIVDSASKSEVSMQHILDQIIKSEEVITGAIGEVKADTENILDIQQAIILGSLPKNHFFFFFANDRGQNPWLIAAVSGLTAADLNSLKAGIELKTISSDDPTFKAMVVKAGKIRRAYYKKHGHKLSVKEISTDLVHTKHLEAQVADITVVNADLVKASEVVATELRVTTAHVETLETQLLTAKKVVADLVQAKRVETEEFRAQTAHIDVLNANIINAKKIVVDLIEANKIYANELHAKTVYIGELQQKLRQEQQKRVVAESRPPEVRVQTQTVYADMPALVGMRINVAGEGRCDHNPFPPGIVSTDVMEATNGRGGDVIEVIFDEKTGMRHAKRLHTNPDGWSYVYQWINPNGAGGDCVWLFQKDDMFTIEQLQQLLRAGESLVPRMVSEMDHEYWGREMTEGTFLVHKVGDVPVTE